MKATWVKVNGTWKQIRNVWTKVNGVWKQKVIPKAKMSGEWKELMGYYKGSYIYNPILKIKDKEKREFTFSYQFLDGSYKPSVIKNLDIIAPPCGYMAWDLKIYGVDYVEADNGIICISAMCDANAAFVAILDLKNGKVVSVSGGLTMDEIRDMKSNGDTISIYHTKQDKEGYRTNYLSIFDLQFNRLSSSRMGGANTSNCTYFFRLVKDINVGYNVGHVILENDYYYSGSRLSGLTKSGTFSKELNKPEQSNLTLLTLDKDDNIYIKDAYGSVDKYSPSLEKIYTRSKFGVNFVLSDENGDLGFIDGSNTLGKLSFVTGNTLWNKAIGSGIKSVGLDINGNYVVTDNNNSLIFIDSRTGGQISKLDNLDNLNIIQVQGNFI